MEENYNGEALEYTVIEQKKVNNWDVAVGLQEVDGLKPSIYLKELINNDFNSKTILNMLKEYYKTQDLKKENVLKECECDFVSTRIVELLEENNFELSINYLKNVHKQLFQDIYEFNGTFRNVNISKNEFILNGDSVIYSDFNMIEKQLEYDFNIEVVKNYQKMNAVEYLNSIIDFTSRIWQIHPFREGNTRTVAIFIIKYLNYLNMHVQIGIFKDNSKYFRNALVRSCYYNNYLDIKENNGYLIKFFENLILGKHNNLQSIDLMVEKLFKEGDK